MVINNIENMNLNDIYHFIRKFLFEVASYLLLQAIVMLVLAVVIILYPYTLNLLVALGFFVTALVSLYFMVRVGVLFHKVRKFGKLVK
ncbi:hypothetical protein A2533_00250 [Candidatus Falkowbacteria bacterium RIFOXYD2_FULL_35_9]|nr:MAG: hypothetical protein A2223_01560 [Candidatus Falkowbacteria bacterium RIFOXYA2_FULL_35_8]OGF46010.1 MAG: hypothetical protein A2533_00250 [Candidatus Falkowbacteria bacterium RIFOXYD2_FULL_35_9]